VESDVWMEKSIKMLVTIKYVSNNTVPLQQDGSPASFICFVVSPRRIESIVAISYLLMCVWAWMAV